MSLQTQGTLEVGDATNKIVLDPAAKTLSFSWQCRANQYGH